MKKINKSVFTLAEVATHVGKSKNKRKFAFTLAEVLVTLGIIGVVAVLTVPNVISNYQKKVYVTQLQKAYNQISNALELLMVDEEVDNLNDTSLFCSEKCYEDGLERVKLYEFLTKYFKVVKNCLGHYEDPECVVVCQQIGDKLFLRIQRTPVFNFVSDFMAYDGRNRRDHDTSYHASEAYDQKQDAEEYASGTPCSLAGRGLSHISDLCAEIKVP